MKNVAFHSLLTLKMIILSILYLIHLFLKGWESLLFVLGSEKVKTELLTQDEVRHSEAQVIEIFRRVEALPTRHDEDDQSIGHQAPQADHGQEGDFKDHFDRDALRWQLRCGAVHHSLFPKW